MVYLIDASALVLALLKRPVSDLLGARTRILRLITSSREGDGEYRGHVQALSDLVSSKKGGAVMTYDLRSEHSMGVEDIFLADQRLSRRDNEKPLSGLDGLVIAMGKSLMKDHPRVCVVTAERRMARVCQSDPSFPRAVCIIRDEIPGL